MASSGPRSIVLGLAALGLPLVDFMLFMWSLIKVIQAASETEIVVIGVPLIGLIFGIAYWIDRSRARSPAPARVARDDQIEWIWICVAILLAEIEVVLVVLTWTAGDLVPVLMDLLRFAACFAPPVVGPALLELAVHGLDGIWPTKPPARRKRPAGLPPSFTRSAARPNAAPRTTHRAESNQR